MSTILEIADKVTDKVMRFDLPVSSPLGPLDQFHAVGASPVTPNGDIETPISEEITRAPLTEKTYEDGLAEGRLQALDEAESQHADIREAAQNISQAAHMARTQIEASHGRVVTQFLQAVLPSLANNHALAEIRDFILRLSAPALQGCVTVHLPAHIPAQAHLHKQLEEILQEIAATSTGNVPEFKLETNICKEGSQDTKIHATWQGGGAKIDIEGATEQCLTLLQNSLDNDGGDGYGTA